MSHIQSNDELFQASNSCHTFYKTLPYPLPFEGVLPIFDAYFYKEILTFVLGIDPGSAQAALQWDTRLKKHIVLKMKAYIVPDVVKGIPKV